MPYQLLTNVASYDTLLEAIRDFLVAATGWTIHQNLITPDEDLPDTPPSNIPNKALGRQLVMSQGDCLVGFRSTTNGPGTNRLYMFDGIPPWAGSPSLDSMNGNSGQRYDPNGITGNSLPAERHLIQFAGPYPKCYLFTNNPSTYCHVVVELTTGRYRHMYFGNLQKFGTWTGGGYYGITYWAPGSTVIDAPSSTQHAVPFDSTASGERGWTVHYEFGADKWISPDADGVLNTVQRRRGFGTMRGGWGRAFYNIPETPFSGLIALAPVLVGAIRTTDTPDTARFIGRVPDVAAVNIQNLAPGASYFIGSDEWVVFPWVQKNGATNNENSGVHGIAYLKRT